jgi:Asp-tRNA(Asn)/Glu-tRNA(Gln) amidotransferase A subunit family amidase
MAMDYTADNLVFGRTNNPRDPSLTPGGSSGGEAAAIATRMSPGGIGSDLAGSIRIPAHFCGITGMKPTVGRVPSGGQFPPSIGPYSLGSVIGPMARSVNDLRLLFNVLAKVQDSSKRSLDKPHALMGRRVSWYVDDGVSPVTDETKRAVEAAAQILADAGLIPEEIRPPGVERGHDLWLKLFSRASVVLLRNVYTGHEEKAGDFVRWRLANADNDPPATLDDYISSWLERDRLRRELIEWMNETPLILAPVGATPALPHDTHKVVVGGQTLSTFRAFSYSQTYNVFDLPAVVIPIGSSAAGLPIGVQIIGRPFDEENVLAAAAIIEVAMAG